MYVIYYTSLILGCCHFRAACTVNKNGSTIAASPVFWTGAENSPISGVLVASAYGNITTTHHDCLCVPIWCSGDIIDEHGGPPVRAVGQSYLRYLGNPLIYVDSTQRLTLFQNLYSCTHTHMELWEPSFFSFYSPLPCSCSPGSLLVFFI